MAEKTSERRVVLSDLKPTLDRVLVKKYLPKTAGKGGIVLPDVVGADERGTKCVAGVVVAVGPGREKDDGTLIPMRFKVDDFVFVDRFAGGVVQVLNESSATIELTVVGQDEILCTA